MVFTDERVGHSSEFVHLSSRNIVGLVGSLDQRGKPKGFPSAFPAVSGFHPARKSLSRLVFAHQLSFGKHFLRSAQSQASADSSLFLIRSKAGSTMGAPLIDGEPASVPSLRCKACFGVPCSRGGMLSVVMFSRQFIRTVAISRSISAMVSRVALFSLQ